MSLEKRMYFFVPYNISPIQQAIQAGHAALNYAINYKDDEEFIDFAKNWKTWIILNGGTTNTRWKEGANLRKDPEPYFGTLNNIAQQVIMNKVNYSIFQEYDLNDALTAVCFICDERVFNYKEYPDFHVWLSFQEITAAHEKTLSYTLIDKEPQERLRELFPVMFKNWVEFLGGEKNVFLRNLIKDKKLA